MELQDRISPLLMDNSFKRVFKRSLKVTFSPFGRSCAKGLIAIRHATHPLAKVFFDTVLGFSFAIGHVARTVFYFLVVLFFPPTHPLLFSCI